MSATSSSTPPSPADVQHYPAIPSYVVALSVVAAAVVSALVIFILYSCLVQRYKKRVWRTVEQSPTRETEQLREETAVEHDAPLSDTAAEITLQAKPQPSPSIFSRGDFLMEVLEGVENTTDLSIDDGDAENSSHVCEDDRVTVAMDDLEKGDSKLASQFSSTPPRQSLTMEIFLETLSTPPVNPTRGPLGLRVREAGQAAGASTLALRGSISSGEGGSDSEGGEVIVCRDIEIYEDPVGGRIYEDLEVGEIYEDLAEGEIYEDPLVRLVKDVEVGIECCEDETDDLVNGGDIKEKGSSDKNKSITGPIEEIPSPNVVDGLNENESIIPEVDLDETEVEDIENCPASESIIKEKESFSIEVGDIELSEDIKEYKGTCSSEIPSPPSLEMPHTTSPLFMSPLQASICMPELDLTPATTIPVNIIPVSNQKVPLPNTASAQLSHSTPTSLLHPLVSMHALPLTERALSVSHLSLNRSGRYLPATPLSCNSEYSPVYNMQAGIARRLATEETAAEAVDRMEVKVKECEGEGEEVDASEVNQELT